MLANGVSQFIWSRGVPDFIHFYSLSPDVWDVADFAIWWGLVGGVTSIAVAALIAYGRDRRAQACRLGAARLNRSEAAKVCDVSRNVRKRPQVRVGSTGR